MSAVDLGLVGAAFATSLISGLLGLGGGMLLISIMSQFYPPLVVLPVHGMVQLASNSSRAAVHWRHIEPRIAWMFAFGAAIGATIGGLVVVRLSQPTFQVILGAFVLFATYVPLPAAPAVGFPGRWAVLGGANGFLSLFVGANGPLVAPFFLRSRLGKLGIIATSAACQIATHGLKMVVFLFAGFALTRHGVLAVSMVLAAILGSWVSRFLVKRLPDRGFRLAFRALVTVLAVRLLYLGLTKSPA